jgi:hypothetical protein
MDRIINMVHRFAGTLVLVTAALGFFHSRYWLFATMFAGLNMLQWSFTGFCPLERILRRTTCVGSAKS